MSEKKETIHVGAEVSPELSEKLDWLARTSRRSRAETIRILIEQAELDDVLLTPTCAQGRENQADG